MAEGTSRYNDWLASKLADPKRAARYLSAAYEDSPPMFLKALRKVVSAQSRSMTDLAEAIGVSRESLHRMMSETGNPTYANFNAILSAMGFKVQILAATDEWNDGSKSQMSALGSLSCSSQSIPAAIEGIEALRGASSRHTKLVSIDEFIKRDKSNQAPSGIGMKPQGTAMAMRNSA